MVEITVDMVRRLREKTGSGIALCKEALVSARGDFEEAELYLRKKDKESAAKKSQRATGEGAVFVRQNDACTRGMLVEIACETDFVARNEQFQALGELLLDAVDRAPAIDELTALATPDGRTVERAIHEAVATTGENIRLARAAVLEAPAGGAVGFYRHFTRKAASLVSLSLEGLAPESAAVQDLARELCMHITSCRPLGLAREDIPEKILAREREVYLDEVKNKPPEIREKIVAGKLAKFFATRCLAEQNYVKDESVKVKDFVAAALQAVGGGGAPAGFVRFELGSPSASVGAKEGAA
ncbi:MAG: translation elongation factor Ts [Planctomycetota bacterium]